MKYAVAISNVSLSSKRQFLLKAYDVVSSRFAKSVVRIGSDKISVELGSREVCLVKKGATDGLASLPRTKAVDEELWL